MWYESDLSHVPTPFQWHPQRTNSVQPLRVRRANMLWSERLRMALVCLPPGSSPELPWELCPRSTHSSNTLAALVLQAWKLTRRAMTALPPDTKENNTPKSRWWHSENILVWDWLGWGQVVLLAPQLWLWAHRSFSPGLGVRGDGGVSACLGWARRRARPWAARSELALGCRCGSAWLGFCAVVFDAYSIS